MHFTKLLSTMIVPIHNKSQSPIISSYFLATQESEHHLPTFTANLVRGGKVWMLPSRFFSPQNVRGFIYFAFPLCSEISLSGGVSNTCNVLSFFPYVLLLQVRTWKLHVFPKTFSRLVKLKQNTQMTGKSTFLLGKEEKYLGNKTTNCVIFFRIWKVSNHSLNPTWGMAVKSKLLALLAFYFRVFII